jgi:hypothetical protein
MCYNFWIDIFFPIMPYHHAVLWFRNVFITVALCRDVSLECCLAKCADTFSYKVPLYVNTHQFVWYACIFEFLWSVQYAQGPVTKLVSLFNQSDCCKLPCHSHSPLHDGCILPKCATWTNHLTDTSGETRRRWPSNSG